MLKLIKNGKVHAPDYLEQKDILLIGDKIGYIAEQIDEPKNFVDIEVIDASGKLVVPGFIDSHVHILGGGGEGGFKTRTPEIQLTDLTRGGVTTVVGCLGTDGTTRSMAGLLAKARGLEEEGITTFIYTGNYAVPVRTITGNIQDDIIMIDKVIGVGEIAISDHRSAQPTVQEITRIAAEARVGGILSGKAGIVNIHVGSGSRKVDFLLDIAENTEIPIKQFVPTHMNRNQELFEQAIYYAKKGGIVDFTTSSIKKSTDHGEVKSSKALKRMLEEKIDIHQITFTSDGQGSLPEFDENGNYLGLGVGKVISLYQEVRDAVLDEGVAIETAIRVITSNPADLLKLNGKGYIKAQYDADLVLLNQDDLQIDTVIAKGQTMILHGDILVKGTFEK
ncbi:beta-aspartyl-peptidase [Tepidibacillus decaturensis]|uniref:Isoaspartyl dipeptidase n=1 Tax=Tepidibacillus decaturensis TaxID=1413211 RepID=A0A135L1E3_9BACI|nr:beta-aspartyl-peptidase [Tepidibacillus decaturensis]KXG42719.1 beta-aspartyl-peptidase [Tepidibacillus decaturensis]